MCVKDFTQRLACSKGRRNTDCIIILKLMLLRIYPPVGPQPLFVPLRYAWVAYDWINIQGFYLQESRGSPG